MMDSRLAAAVVVKALDLHKMTIAWVHRTDRTGCCQVVGVVAAAVVVADTVAVGPEGVGLAVMCIDLAVGEVDHKVRRDLLRMCAMSARLSDLVADTGLAIMKGERRSRMMAVAVVRRNARGENRRMDRSRKRRRIVALDRMGCKLREGLPQYSLQCCWRYDRRSSRNWCFAIDLELVPANLI